MGLDSGRDSRAAREGIGNETPLSGACRPGRVLRDGVMGNSEQRTLQAVGMA